MTFLWSDAWLLQAIAVAATNGPATLGEIIGAADATNHALPTNDELHGALVRLTAAGFVEEVQNRFRLTDNVPRREAAAIAESGWHRGRRTAAALLKAEEWSAERNVGDPRNQVVYPGLTDDRIRAAEEEYRQRVKR
jgi:hypothetical protein